MKTTKIIEAISCSAVGSVLGWWAMKGSWMLSLITGPLQHLALAVGRIDNSDEYLDGMRRVSVGDYFIAALQITLWVLGVVAIFHLFGGLLNKSSIFCIVLGWILVGALNIYLFAIRSV